MRCLALENLVREAGWDGEGKNNLSQARSQKASLDSKGSVVAVAVPIVRLSVSDSSLASMLPKQSIVPWLRDGGEFLA